MQNTFTIGYISPDRFDVSGNVRTSFAAAAPLDCNTRAGLRAFPGCLASAVPRYAHSISIAVAEDAGGFAAVAVD